jgi:hypothetical protein
MVNGYGFITHDRSFVDMILTALNPTPKPTPKPTPTPTPTPKPKPVLNYVEVCPVEPEPEVKPAPKAESKSELNYVEVYVKPEEEEDGEGSECEGCGVRESTECKSDCSYQAKRREEEK